MLKYIQGLAGIIGTQVPTASSAATPLILLKLQEHGKIKVMLLEIFLQDLVECL
jgi:hypothetical protein